MYETKIENKTIDTVNPQELFEEETNLALQELKDIISKQDNQLKSYNETLIAPLIVEFMTGTDNKSNYWVYPSIIIASITIVVILLKCLRMFIYNNYLPTTDIQMRHLSAPRRPIQSNMLQ